MNCVTVQNLNGSENVNEILLLLFPSPAAPDLVAPHCSEMQGETLLVGTGSHSVVDYAELKGISTSYYGSSSVLGKFVIRSDFYTVVKCILYLFIIIHEYMTKNIAVTVMLYTCYTGDSWFRSSLSSQRPF